MRRAQVEKAWRAVGNNRQLHVRHVASPGVPPLGEIDESLPNGLTVICGLNGVGKSTLLRLVEATLNGTESVSGRCRPSLLATAPFSLDIMIGPTGSVVTLGESSPVCAVLLDAFDLCARLIRFGMQPNYQDLFEGVEPYDFSADERSIASYIVGVRYDAVSIVEVEEPGSDGERVLAVPIVSRGGLTYSFTAMGTGELAALTLLWQLRAVEPGSVVLLEEPETFLSSHAAVALLDVLAEQIDARRLYAVVTTHSMDIVSHVPLEYVRLLVSAPSGTSIRRPTTRAELEWFLGSVGGQARLTFVEDKTAGIFAGELIGRMGGLWAHAIAVHGVGGVDNVLALCRLLPRAPNLAVVGVIDGDQEHPPADRTTWPIVVLPGEGDPNSILREAAVKRRELFCERLGRANADVDSALDRYESVDAHDWFADVSTALNLTETIVIRAAIECWLADPDNDAAAAGFVQKLTHALVDLR